MKAAYLLDGEIHTGSFPDPEPGPGQVLVRTCCCGMCASDLHMQRYGKDLVAWSNAYDGPFKIDLSRPLIMGHEYVAEIIDFGPETDRRLPKGQRVTAQPGIGTPKGREIVGLSSDCPGGFGELMLLSEQALLPIPESLESELAAMTEPMGVGLGYVQKARLTAEDTPLVVGCGAIGLSTIMALKLTDARPIIASDFSEARRRQALACGADIVVDPAQSSPFAPQGARAPNVIFECVGVTGVVDQIIRNCGYGARIIVAGWCLEPDQQLTVCAHTKALNIQYGGGTSADSFAGALELIAAGKLDPRPWLGATVGLGGVAQALANVADADNAIRTLVDPSLP